MTFEEFKFKFDEHIEGKAQTFRTARTSTYGESVRSKSATGKKNHGAQPEYTYDD